MRRLIQDFVRQAVGSKPKPWLRSRDVNEARTLEAEARTLDPEAEARTLEAEAEAKTLEAEARTLEARAEDKKFWPPKFNKF